MERRDDERKKEDWWKKTKITPFQSFVTPSCLCDVAMREGVAKRESASL
jgi:hypothetical protein